MQLNIAMFECENLYREDSPIYYLKEDYNVECWTTEHILFISLFALPLLIFWSIIFPLIIFLKIRRFKDKLDDLPPKLNKYTFFFRGYKSNYYYWENVVFARKFLAIFIITIAGLNSAEFQMYVSVYIMIVSI
mmetsp:Transcript_38898/g.34581  ORF Transcript_38898/g.34581 Transcript_38898/m.34581 type:complete len:133 (+) Transcript_38898:1434-1832(+)